MKRSNNKFSYKKLSKNISSKHRRTVKYAIGIALITVITIGAARLVSAVIIYGMYLAPPPTALNPLITPRSCSIGLNISLVADTSGSFTPQYLAQEKAALQSFVSTLLPNPKIRIALIQFSDTGDIVKNFTGDPASLTTAIEKLKRGGGTNWEAGLKAASLAYSGGPPGAHQPGNIIKSPGAANLVIVATDGNPTLPVWNVGTPLIVGLNNAVAASNTLKKGQRSAFMVAAVPPLHILALGIHVADDPRLGLTKQQSMKMLQDITGPNVNTGGINADVITTDYSTMAQTLKNLATDSCSLGSGGGGTTGGGSGGAGDGSGGSGTGNGGGGSGGGTTGTGSGGSGTGSGNGGGSGSSGTTPNPAPNPAPTAPKNDPKPSPSPSNGHKDPTPAPLSKPTQTSKKPATKPNSQGTKKLPPKSLPSPFLDGGILYKQGTIKDSLKLQSEQKLPLWQIIVVGASVTVVTAVAGGVALHQKSRLKRLTKRSKRKK